MDFGEARRHQRIRPPAGAVKNMRRLGLTGRQRVFVEASRGVVASSLDCGWSLAIAGRYRGPWPVRASVVLSRVLVEAGVTPAVHLHGPAPKATPHHNPYSAGLARRRRTRCNRGCGTCGVGLFVPLVTTVQRRPRKN